METVEVYRSREVVGDDQLQTLLNSLTLDQVRSAIEVLAPTKKISLKSRKDSLEAVIRTHRSVAEIQSTLLDIEASAPFRHCVFSRLQGAGVIERAAKLSPDPNRRSKGYRMRVSYVTQTASCVSITLEHTVQVREWDTKSPTKREIQNSQMRHPI